MKANLLSKSVRFVSAVLIASILVSCTASQHAGVANTQRPPLTETNENTWFAYWEDQLDANRGRVIAPAMEYPPVAHHAYERAVQDWNMKAKEAETQTYLAWTAGLLGASVVLYLIIVSGASGK